MRNILFTITSIVRQTNLPKFCILSAGWQTNLNKLCCSTTPFSRSFSTTEKASGHKDKDIGMTTVKVRFPVECDPKKLVNYVCGTDFLEEELEPVKIKPDSEYPDWLWTVRLEKAPPLDEMDPTSKAYWRRTKAQLRRYKKELRKIRKIY